MHDSKIPIPIPSQDLRSGVPVLPFFFIFILLFIIFVHSCLSSERNTQVIEISTSNYIQKSLLRKWDLDELFGNPLMDNMFCLQFKFSSI